MRQDQKLATTLRPMMFALLAAAWSGASFADDGDNIIPESQFKLGGYVRGAASMNLQDQPETKGNDKGKLSMLRGSLLLDADYKLSTTAQFKAVARVDREANNSYLKSLEEAPGLKPGGSTAVIFSTNGGGNIGGLMNNYNQGELREFWGQFDINDRVKVKLGKQQIVWGETDFFRAMDIVHGFDYRWRSFLEVENEELRKPLIMGRMMVQVPEAKGSVDAYIRPGWDRDRDISNTYDLTGGRWAAQPTRGASFLYATGYNYRSQGADVRDVTGGIRWQGMADKINYSLALANTFNNDPVANPCPATLALLGSNGAKVFKQAPTNCGFASKDPFGNPLQFGDWIFPKTSILGLTASGYSNAMNAVLSTEIVYQKDRAFNYGFIDGKFGPNITPGAFGVIQKNTLTTMFRIDKNLDLTGIIGTSRPSFGSLQLFNTRILGFDRNDEIVQLAYWDRARSRDSAMLTAILGMNYSNDRINPSIAAGWDVTYGGGFFIPSIEWVLGDNWRVKGELDLFYAGGNTKNYYLNPTTFAFDRQGSSAALMGYFANSNQLAVRVTRQF